MTAPSTLYRAPKGAILALAPRRTSAQITAGEYPTYREAGRLLDGSATVNAEAVVRQEWDQTACAAYEDDRSFPVKSMSLALTVRSQDAYNLATILQGTRTAVTGASESDFTTNDDIAAGDLIVLPKPSTGTLTVVDSAGTPASVTAGTHYEFVGASAQVIRVLDVSGFTLPWVITWTSDDHTVVTFADALTTRWRVGLFAVNSANSCTTETAEFWDCVVDSGSTLTLNLPPDSTDESPVPVTFTARVDPDAPTAAVLGKIGRILTY